MSVQRQVKRAVLGVVCLSLAACQGRDSDPDGALPEELRARAVELMDAAQREHLAPEWEHATLGAARPVYRPDVEGPAYYEVAVERDGAPAGFVVLSTGQHDYPVVQWNPSGPRPSDRLEEKAALTGHHIVRYYRFDIEPLGETEDGDLVASDTTVLAPVELRPPSAELLAQRSDATYELARGEPFASWSDAKARYREAYAPYLETLRSSAKEAWDAAESEEHRPPGVAVANFGTAFQNPGTYCVVNDAVATPHYDQLEAYEQPSGRWFYSGCAATAWAILLGWADQQAFEGDPKWTSFRGLYRQAGATQTWAPDARAPNQLLWGAKIVTDAIASTLGTWGVSNPTGMSEGATEPWRMSYVTNYLYTTGMNGSLIASTFEYGGVAYDSLRDRAVHHICTDQTPAVVGIGALDHYAVATQWWLVGGTHYFYLNMGHGRSIPSDDGWYAGGIYFAGSFIPQFQGPGAVERRGMEVTAATYGGNCGAPANDVASATSSWCNDSSNCDFFVDHTVLGDPAPNCAKDYRLQFSCSDTDPQLHEVTLTPEASGKDALASCPTVSIVSATYGGNCGAPVGNENFWAAWTCAAATQCALVVDHNVLGDPAPGCAKNFVVNYRCAGGPVKTATVAAEAGFGSRVALSCP